MRLSDDSHICTRRRTEQCHNESPRAARSADDSTSEELRRNCRQQGRPASRQNAPYRTFVLNCRLLPPAGDCFAARKTRDRQHADVTAPPTVTTDAAPLAGIAVTRAWRIVVAALATLSRGSLLVLALLAWFAPERLPTGTVLRGVELFCFLPELAAWLIRRAHATTFAVADDALVLRGRAAAIEVPLASITAVLPWRIPLPAPGFRLGLRSGAPLPEGLMPSDPAAFVRILAIAGVPARVLQAASRHPFTVYASAKGAARRRVDHPFVKFVLFSLVPTVPLFRLRQLIVYGGILGEYYQYGPRSYLLGFGIFWLLYGVYLLLYAAVLRAATEVIALLAAWRTPAAASRVRRGAEWIHRVLYYGGIPAVLALRLFPW